jgi:flavin reductase (DIM6/NTAB) family NADH-FMN oxidoreductase RutF
MNKATAMQIDKRELRNILGTFVTGVTVVTTLAADGSPRGVTVNSFASVSLDPPLVLWSQGLSTHSYPVFRDAERFVVNILAHDQVHLSKLFSSPVHDRFSDLAYSSGLGGMPVLAGCSAILECRKVATYPGGDHAVFLGEIENCRRDEHQPLAFSHGRYSIAQHIEAA